MNIEVLNKYKEDGLLYSQVHPSLPLTIWNYAEKVQYEGLWDEITLSCRGLVTDNNGNIVARPWKKFFNMEEGKHTPTSEFEVFEKMDGSLGILFYYEGNWVFATRGSFSSDQAIRGFEILKKYDYHKLQKKFTYLFEIIYDENRIVCRYDFEDLILLSMIETETGYEVNLYSDFEDLRYKNLINNIGLKLVKRYDGISDYTTLKGMISNNAEGFVIRFSNGDRMKIKGEEYLRLHKIMTNLSTTAVWGILSNGDNIEELLIDVPDEFYDKIKSYTKDLRYGFMLIQEHAGKLYDSFYESTDGLTDVSKKDYAMWVQKQQKHLHPILFKMYDRKPYSEIIWKLMRPEFKKL
jgi:T4 RnlA family RNA ligase